MSRFERWSRRKRGLEIEDQPEQQAFAPSSSQTPLEPSDARESSNIDLSPAPEEEHAKGSLQEQEDARSQLDNPADHIDAELPDPDTLAPKGDFSAFLQHGVSPALKRRALRRMFTAENYNVRDGLDDYDHDFTKMRKLDSETSAQLRSWMRKLTEETEEPADEIIEESPLVASAPEETGDMDEKANASSDEAAPCESKNPDNHADEVAQENIDDATDPVRPTNRPV
nr:DUF3306 domain-containing protein [uncultured Halomonas sp.]